MLSTVHVAAFGVNPTLLQRAVKDSRMNVSYNGNVRFSTATQIPEMPNSYDFARYWNDAAANSGGNAPFSQDMLNKIKNHIKWHTCAR